LSYARKINPVETANQRGGHYAGFARRGKQVLAKAESKKRQAEKFTGVSGNFQPCDSGFEFGLRFYFAHFLCLIAASPFRFPLFPLVGRASRRAVLRFHSGLRFQVSGFPLCVFVALLFNHFPRPVKCSPVSNKTALRKYLF